MRWLAVAALGAMVTIGCGPTPPVTPRAQSLPEQRPAAFALDVLVRSPIASTTDLPRALRPGRYIVDPGGVLRAAVGAGATRQTYPPHTRQLSSSQIEALWRAVRDSGFLDSANPAQVDDPDTLAGSTTRTTATIEVFGLSRPVAVRVALDRGGATSIAAEQLVDELAGLAWQRDPPVKAEAPASQP